VLRKTVATHVSEAFDAEYAAKQLGHTVPDVTRRHYIEKAAVGRT
jgi:integrase